MKTINLLYYKALLDQAMIRFFNDFNDQFSNINGKYYLTKKFSKSKIEKIFLAYIYDILNKMVTPWIVTNQQYYLIIDGCNPFDNLLLKYKTTNYFPAKLSSLINTKIKYVLKESDISLDINELNLIFLNIFNKLFSGKSKVSDISNLIFIRHDKIDCYIIFKLIKHIIGRNSCVNLWENQFKFVNPPLIAVNDLIDKYIHSKHELNRDPEFKQISVEISDFLADRLNLKRIA